MTRSSQAVPASKNTKSNKTPTKTKQKPKKTAVISTEQRIQMINELAYSFAEQRGFTPGNEQSDWIEAEKQIDSQLLN